MKFKPGILKLTPGTKKLISEIENEELRDLLSKGLHPSEVVEGWYSAVAMAVLRVQKGIRDE